MNSIRAKRILAIFVIIVVAIMGVGYLLPVISHPQEFYSAFSKKMEKERTTDHDWQTRIANAWTFAYTQDENQENAISTPETNQNQ